MKKDDNLKVCSTLADPPKCGMTGTRTPEDCPNPEWRDALEDPLRKKLLANGPPNLDEIMSLFPRTVGEERPFDPLLIAANIERLKTIPEVNTGHPFLDLSVKTGLAFVDATFQGDHPKYGVGGYAETRHDTFPPVIIAAVDALSAWGLNARAVQLFRYWLLTFVRSDGTINYEGTSICEYGQLLHTAVLLEKRAGIRGWWDEGFPALNRMVEFLLGLHAKALKEDGLLTGAPEDDERYKIGKYFHNNAWAAKGLEEWADLCQRQKVSPSTPADIIRGISQTLAKDTLQAIGRTWPKDPSDWWLPPQVEPLERPNCLTGTREASYTNYRYWPELLSSGILPPEMAMRVVNARLSGGGQFCGMTRYMHWLDDWPLADYLYALWDLGRKDDFLLSLYGHVAYHQAGEHLTAYEQVTFPPCKENAPSCLPCQLVAARAARFITCTRAIK